MLKSYALKKPANRHARIGAFYAALLPVIIGLLLLGKVIGGDFGMERAIITPISISLVFGTPIVAWLSQDAIAKRNRLDYWKLLEITLTRATILQLIFGSLCIVYLYNSTLNLFEFKSLISAFITGHTMLWFVLTLPLSMVCIVIFKLTALRPIYG